MGESRMKNRPNRGGGKAHALPEKIPQTKPITPNRSYALILSSNPIPLAPLPVPPLFPAILNRHAGDRAIMKL